MRLWCLAVSLSRFLLLLLLLLCSRAAMPAWHLPCPSASTTQAPPSHHLMQGGGVRVNNEKVDDELHVLQEGDLIDGRLVLIAAGKKNKMLVRAA